jgi:hypothetical protein
VPGKDRGEVKLIEYRNRVEIYRGREKQIEHDLPPIEVRNKKIKPPGIKDPPRSKNQKSRMALDEAKIRTNVPEVSSFLDKALQAYPGANAKSNFLKNLSGLHRKLSKAMFIEAVHRAEKYGVMDVTVIERISIQLLRNSLLELPLPEVALEFADSEIYQEGRQSPAPDLSLYKAETTLSDEEKVDG